MADIKLNDKFVDKIARWVEVIRLNGSPEQVRKLEDALRPEQERPGPTETKGEGG